MTSMVYDLNSSSFPDLNEDLLLSPNLSSASLSDYLPNFDHHHNTTQYISSSETTRFTISSTDPNNNNSSNSSFEFDQAAAKNERISREEYAAIDYCRPGIEGSSSSPPPPVAKWIPTKMRITQKMSETSTDKPLKYTLRFHPNNSYYNDNSSSSSSNSSIRVCSDCNTTTTPLWRSGPKGPKSLCNACGIRQRKARRALAAAGEAAAMGNSSSSSSMGLMETYSSCGKSSSSTNYKEKKLRAGHVTQCKKSPNNPKINSLKNFVFNNSSAALFPLPQDVEQAAILLMELSCGLLHHAS